jgi:hypothetical protein
MFKRIVKVAIPANVNNISLPSGTHKTADISVSSDGEGFPIKFTHSAANPQRIDFAAAATVRKVIITVSQEYPFNTDHIQKFGPRAFLPNKQYQSGEMVTAYGGVYICDKDYNNGAQVSIRDLLPLSTPAGVVVYTPFDTMGEGWWRCDGSMINAPYSKLHGYYTVDMRNKYASGGNYNNNIPAGGQMGSYFNNNNLALDVRHLPSNSFSVSVSQDPAKYAYLDRVLPLPRDCSGDPDGATDTNGNYPRAYWRGWDNIQTNVVIPQHSHTASVQLNPQGQIMIDKRPASANLNAFIRL